MSLQSIDLPARPRKPRVYRKPRSLFQFLSWRGGLKPQADLLSILDGRHRSLVRKAGLSLDAAREAAIEEGFLQDSECREHEPSINDLLDLIAAEAAGQKQYRIHEAVDAYEAAGALTRAGHVASRQTCEGKDATQQEQCNMPHGFMSAKKYRDLSEQTGLAQFQLHKKLGISIRSAYRFANGRQPVPETTGKLLIMLAKHGIPKDF